MSTFHITDTGLFVVMEQLSNSRYKAIRRFAYRNDITFILPERVYDELAADESDARMPPVDTAIEEGVGDGLAAGAQRGIERSRRSDQRDPDMLD